MKGIIYQCVYDIDDKKYPYTAFNYDGSLCGFQNLPVRNFNLGIWVDSVTGDTGEVLPYEQWDQSARDTAIMKDCRASKINRKEKPFK